MKINWGLKIVLAYGVFVAGIMYMVYISSQQNRDLVSENYYADELAYQKIIDESSNTASLQSKVEVSTSEGNIHIAFPKDFQHASIEGEWVLYYAADESRDLKGNVNTSAALYSIAIPSHAKGTYQLKLHWKSNNANYYFEQSIFLQ